MSDKNITEFERLGRPKARSSFAQTTNEEKVVTGGREGPKYLTTLSHPEKNHDYGQYFIKTQKDYETSYVRRLVETYETARAEGFPVPPTVRYFEKDQTASILMTDMSEKGKYVIWGYNDFSIDSEREALKSMNLTPDDMSQIKNQCDSIVENANKQKRFIRFHNFHIRKAGSGGKVQVFLLDLSASFLGRFDKQEVVRERNQMHEDIFMELLSAPPEDHPKVIDKYLAKL